MILLECRNLSKKFDNKYVLDNINIKIPKGKIIGLLGKNGSGKTTLIKLINDLLTPTSGEILFKGEKIGVKSKRKIAYLPDKTYLDSSKKVKDVLKFFNDFYDNFNLKKANKLIDELNIDMDCPIYKMSKGVKEKFNLILVISRDADLYVLDEPLLGVDASSRDYIIKTIITNFKEGSSVLISTHFIKEIEKILDGVIFLSDGKIVLNSSCDELRKNKKKSIEEIFKEMFK